MAAIAQDPFRRRRALWFLLVNLIALVIAVLVFLGVLYGDALSSVFEPLMRGLYEYKLAVILIAMSPLFASLLVGMAYAQRAIRRKRAAASVEKIADATP
jgi:uncharacterized membrane protein